jgi:glycosyltransferase involved in cell wall biosynthesis
MRKNKPILFISPLPPPQGGIAMWTKKLMTEGLPDGSPITLVDTKIRGRRNIFDSVFFSFAEITRTLSIFGALLRQLVTRHPKLIHLNCSLSGIGVLRDAACVFMAKIFCVPVIVHYHGNLKNFSGTKFFGLSRTALRFLMRTASANIVINTPSYQKAKDFFPRKNTLKMLPNFAEETLFSYAKKITDNSRLQAIFAGGITTAKGCGEILIAANALPEIDFHLYGKMHSDLAQTFASPPPNIILHGEVEHKKLLGAFAQSDFLLFPSYTEGFPLTVLEAMSIGIPVIATRVGAIPEMIESGVGGYLVQPRDAAELIAAIKSLTQAPQQMTEMGAFNRKRSFEHYRYSIVIKQLLQIYHSILET